MASNAHIAPLRDGDRAPSTFVRHRFVRLLHVDFPVQEVWEWLSDPSTFVDGQIWPWRVEFMGAFEEGVYCNHHGPLMSFPGVVGKMCAPRYRDLRYLYGAYAISPRLVRPTRLQFWTNPCGKGGTDVSIAIDALVHRRFGGVWTRLQRFFWGSFGRWLERGVRKRRRRASAARSLVSFDLPGRSSPRRAVAS